jgi:predicted permease
MLERVWHDLRHGVRMLLKNPGFTIIAVASIAIGIGLNAAMFSLADALALRPLQVPQSSDVIAVTTAVPQQGDAFVPVGRLASYPDYVDLRDRTQSFAGLLAYGVTITSFANRADEPPQTRPGLAVSGNFFDVLRVPPIMGRTFVSDEDRVPGRDAVVVLAYETWRQQFAGDPAIVGRRARVGGIDFTVIGVAPQEFPGMDVVLHPAFYVPMAMMPSLAGSTPDSLERRDLRFLSIRGRLKPGVTLPQADAEVRRLAASLQRLYPDTNRQVEFHAATDLAERRASRGPATPAAWTLMMLAIVVLVVACANVAGLLMSRAPVRAREIALRLAVGGSRVRLVQQLLTESLLIAIIGAALGLAIGYGAISSVGRVTVVSDIGVSMVVQLDRRVLSLTLILTALSALLAGTFPAWRTAASPNLAGTLNRGSVSDAPPARLWGRQVLVAGQVALSLAVLTIGVFLYRTFSAEFSRPGFRTERMLLVNFEPSLARYDNEQAATFYRLLKDRVRELPGVASVGLTSFMPLNQDHRERTAIVPEGYQLPPGTDSINVFSTRVDEGFLSTIGIPLVAGRNISVADRQDTTPVAVINQAMANRYWPGASPIGKRMQVRDGTGRWLQIVGVAADSKYNWVGESATPFLYLAQSQTPGPRATLLVAVTGNNATALAPSVRAVIRELDRNMPASVVRTMEEFYYGSAVAAITQFVRIVAGLGVIGVVLAMVGLYGLVSYSARRRTREIAVRMAIGAQPRSILQMIVRHGLALAAAGTLLGVIGSIAAGRLLGALIPNSQGIDVGTYLLVVPTLVLITAVAALIPAWRAARVDPLVALRTE